MNVQRLFEPDTLHTSSAVIIAKLIASNYLVSIFRPYELSLCM